MHYFSSMGGLTFTVLVAERMEIEIVARFPKRLKIISMSSTMDTFYTITSLFALLVWVINIICKSVSGGEMR